MGKRRGTIWSNLKWVHPERTGYGTGVKSLRERLRYFTYRDDRDVKAPRGGRRWVDCGLGESHREILENCQTMTSGDRLAWTMMLSPKPRLMALIEDEQDRRQFIEDLTEDVVEEWFDARGFANAQFSYIVHDRSTNEDGLSQLHSHVILPGTVETSAGRERFDNTPSDLREFNTLVEDLFEIHMDRQLGLSWRDDWREIQREEALKRYFKSLEIDDLPDNMSDLAKRLHATGYTSEQIPEDITTSEQFNEWLTSLESDEPDLDAWFGRDER